MISGRAVLAALRSKNVDAHPFDPAERELFDLKREGFQRVFIALHGRFGEDGTVQGALEVMRIPYTGSGVMGSAISMDKWRTKLVWSAAGIPTPRYEMVKGTTDWEKVTERLGMPIIVKPAREGSTIGLTKVSTPADFDAAWKLAAKYDQLVLAEEFISGQELTASIFTDPMRGEEIALPLIRIVAPQGNYDYQNKYFTDDTKYFCPSGVRADLEDEIRAVALKSFRVLGCRGWGRADVMLAEDGPLFIPRDEYIAGNDRTQPGADCRKGSRPVLSRVVRAHPRGCAARCGEAPMIGAPVSLRRRVVGVTAGTVAVAALAGGAWYGIDAISSQPIERVDLAGDLQRIAPSDLDAFAHAVQGVSASGASLEAVREAARRIPWVKDVTVRRRFPDAVEVAFEDICPAGAVERRSAGERPGRRLHGRLPGRAAALPWARRFRCADGDRISGHHQGAGAAVRARRGAHALRAWRVASGAGHGPRARTRPRRYRFTPRALRAGLAARDRKGCRNPPCRPSLCQRLRAHARRRGEVRPPYPPQERERPRRNDDSYPPP